MLSVFPKNYHRRINMATGYRYIQAQGPEFRTRLDIAESAQVVFIIQYGDYMDYNILKGLSKRPGKCTCHLSQTTPLPLAMESSGSLHEDIVAKVVIGNGDSTEYTSLQFLAERAPEIPIPKILGVASKIIKHYLFYRENHRGS
ncbi:uncharacterized protein N7515_008184 [Penicillium bovifimosum]|uniref:Uncharacterized protein n=1 Tax=Penicillium bovifimosum TaxID=126998 RepID=A0A9W9KW47_9EURO|nr:uncharacterized protein N7515_008184 [Penicillium bovifimosum]KAJ5124359.1 hypothetical protein N7515_008184 [Penicillium bovifimosum]